MLVIEKKVDNKDQYNFECLSLLYSEISVRIPWCIDNNDTLLVTLHYKYNGNINTINIPKYDLPDIDAIFNYKHNNILFDTIKESLNILTNQYEKLQTIFHYPIAELLFKYIHYGDIFDYTKREINTSLFKDACIIASNPYKDTNFILKQY